MVFWHIFAQLFKNFKHLMFSLRVSSSFLQIESQSSEAVAGAGCGDSGGPLFLLETRHFVGTVSTGEGRPAPFEKSSHDFPCCSTGSPRLYFGSLDPSPQNNHLFQAFRVDRFKMVMNVLELHFGLLHATALSL